MASRSIKGGLVYIGTAALAANGVGLEPCLIDTRFKVNWKRADRSAVAMYNNTSYRGLNPRVRAAYLEWLAGGRRDRSAPIGYVFLFFYGLERRLFADLGADLHLPEVEIILAEVERLLDVYREEVSFARSAGQLLDFVDGVRSVNIDAQPVPWGSARVERGLPAVVRVGIGKYVGERTAIPAGWALSYLRHHPEGRLRTPAKRVAAEFDELFGIRYRERFGSGLRVPKRATKLKLSYQAASPGFGRGVFVTLGEIPDIALDPTLITTLNELAKECEKDLAAYSRLLGRHPDRAGTPAAVGLLPDVLLAERAGPILDGLRVWTSEVLADRPRAVVPLGELVEQWSPGHPSKLTKTDASALVSVLANIGVGIEPDVRFGSPTPSPGSHAVLFPLPEGGLAKSTPLYRAAQSLVHFSAIVAAADGAVNSVELRFLAERLKGIPGLGPADRVRLQAHMAFLGAQKLRLYGVKRRVKAMEPSDLPKVGSLLIDLAAADGVVNREEIAVLERLFEQMGLDEAHLYSRAHTLDLGDSGPVTVREKATDTCWELPDSGQVTARRSVALDPEKVAVRLAETDRVSNLLSDIFEDEDLPQETEPQASGPQHGSMIEELDAPHSRLLNALASRQKWDRGSVEDMARSFGLPFLDSALDVINEIALDVCGEELFEGNDPILLDAHALEELTRHKMTC